MYKMDLALLFQIKKVTLHIKSANRYGCPKKMHNPNKIFLPYV